MPVNGIRKANSARLGIAYRIPAVPMTAAVSVRRRRMRSASAKEMRKPTITAVAVMPTCSPSRWPMTSRLSTTQSGRKSGSPGGIGPPGKLSALQHLADLPDADQADHPFAFVDDDTQLDRRGEHRRQGVAQRGLRLDQAGAGHGCPRIDRSISTEVSRANHAQRALAVVQQQG